MPSGRLSDNDPEAWFHLAIQLDQNQAADEAFYGQVPTLVSLSSSTMPSTLLPDLPEVDPHFDAHWMSADELREMLEGRLAIQCPLEDKGFHTPQVAHTMSVQANTTPLLVDDNWFSVLEVSELETIPECKEEGEAPESPEAQPQLPPKPCRPC